MAGLDGPQAIELLEELVRWARFHGMRDAKRALLEVLDTDLQKQVYQFSDGRSSEDIGRQVGVTGQTVRNYWRAWFSSGLVFASAKNERPF